MTSKSRGSWRILHPILKDVLERWNILQITNFITLTDASCKYYWCELASDSVHRMSRYQAVDVTANKRAVLKMLIFLTVEHSRCGHMSHASWLTQIHPRQAKDGTSSGLQGGRLCLYPDCNSSNKDMITWMCNSVNWFTVFTTRLQSSSACSVEQGTPL